LAQESEEERIDLESARVNKISRYIQIARGKQGEEKMNEKLKMLYSTCSSNKYAKANTSRIFRPLQVPALVAAA
jgi:hypothetical protein